MLKSKRIKALHIDGTRSKGMELRNGNVRACTQLANMLKSSFGPHGLDKMIVDENREITITSDGSSILSCLNVEHPAAKVLVNLAKSQDHQVGDGTTSVVLIAAELLKSGLSLIENDKIHASNVISGFRLAVEESIKFISEKISIKGEITDEMVKAIIGTTFSSKVLGSESKFFSDIVFSAIKEVRRTRSVDIDSKGKDLYPLHLINIVKKHGKSMKESSLIDGFALDAHLSSQLMPKFIKNAKIALLDYNLHRTKLKLGISVEIKDPKKLEKIRQKEIDLIKARIELMFKQGVNVFLTTMGIDDLCSKYLIEKGCMGVRRVDKSDLKRIKKLTGGRIITDFTDIEGNESFNKEDVGEADEVSVERIADDDIIFIRGCKNKKSCSIVLRGANEYMLDEMERTIVDALSSAKRVLENKEVCPGGGAVEGCLSVYLEDYARKIETREQLAIMEFAEAMLVVPKTLAINASLDSTELVAKLRAYHHKGLKDKKEFLKYGLDLENNKVVDQMKNGVLEPTLVKLKILEFATEACISILRIDDLFRLNPKQKPQRQ